MASKDFEKVDKDFDSLKKIGNKISLTDKAFKDLQHDAHRFAEANQARCKPTPRLWKQPIWKTITDEFIDNDDIGSKYWSTDREEFRKCADLEWDEDKDAIRFLCFCVLKRELKTVQTANKRKSVGESEETLTPKSKKAKSATPAKDLSKGDEEAPEQSIEDDEAETSKTTAKKKAGDEEGEKGSEPPQGTTEPPKPKRRPGRPTKTGEPRERYQLGKETKVKEKAAALAKKVEDTAAHDSEDDDMDIDDLDTATGVSATEEKATGEPTTATETETETSAEQAALATPIKPITTDVRNGEVTPSYTPGTFKPRGLGMPMRLKFIVTSKGHEDATTISEWSNVTIQHFLWQAQNSSIGGVRFGIMGAVVAEMTIPDGELISFSLTKKDDNDPQQRWQEALAKAVEVIDSGSFADGAEIRLCLT